MKKIKVLIIAGAMGVGGIENQLMHLLRQSNKSKFRIDFTSTEDKPFYKDEIISLGSKCIKLPATEGRHLLRYCMALYRVMKEGKYDIVHSHELFHSGLVLLTARLAGIKHRFAHAHNWKEGNAPDEKPGPVRRLYNNTMRMLINWNATQKIACSTLAGIFLYGEKATQKENYHIVYNSVDTEKFIQNYDNPETGEFCDDWVNVIQVGRFTPVKNQLFTVKIAEEFKKRGKKIRILCPGNIGGAYDDEVREAIDTRNLSEYMKLLGIRKEIDVLMRKSSVFLLPSLYEGMPLVLIEAQASGLPCVVADTFSHEVDFGIDTVQWLDLSAGPAVWADAVEQAIAQGRAEKEKVVGAVQQHGFDSRVFAKKICDLYEKSMIND